MDRAKREIRIIGRALLALGLQNTHSGNISLRRGRKIYMTASGTLKGHLADPDIVAFADRDPIESVKRASSEARTHRAILEYARAVIHSHAPMATLVSFDSGPLEPVDFLGKFYLGKIPVADFTSPVASPEMAEKIPAILTEHPGMVVRGHGPFVRGDTLEQAMMVTGILEDSARILHLLRLLSIDYRRFGYLNFPAAGYPEHPVLDVRQRHRKIPVGFVSRAADLFFHRISPFRTGSLSEKQDRKIMVSEGASMPGDFRLPLVEVDGTGTHRPYWIEFHRSVYRHSRAASAIFTHSPQAMVQALASLDQGRDGIIPDDAEGQFLYPFIPVVLPHRPPEEVVALAEKHHLAVMAGFGVLSLGNSLAEAIHHCSSLESICRLKTGLAIRRSLGNEIMK